MQKVFYFVAHMPDEPGALHKAAEIVTRYHGNVDRIHYDRRIDPYTVFFEIRCEAGVYERIKKELELLGYLQDSLAVPSFLKFNVNLPNRPGALFEFLHSTTSAGCNIAFLDFDDRGKHPERLTVSLTIEDSTLVQGLLEELKSKYPLEILEYDTTGKHLDDTVFYIRFAQELRQLIGDTEDQFLLRLLSDINHIVQELHTWGRIPSWSSTASCRPEDHQGHDREGVICRRSIPGYEGRSWPLLLPVALRGEHLRVGITGRGHARGHRLWHLPR